jgi:uncharacterized protein
MKKLLIKGVRIYRQLLSPFAGNNCRFEPSCGAYAEEALAKKGMMRGSWLIVKRLAKCQPLHSGGYDPIE